MKKFLLPILFLILSCKKESATITDGTYEVKDEITGGIQLYTSNGNIISTPSVVMDFLKRRALSDALVSVKPLTLTFSGNKVTTNEAVKFDLQRKGDNNFLLVSQDSIKIITAVTSGNISCDNAAIRIRQNQPTLACLPIPTTTGFSYVCSTKQQIPFTYKDDQLEIPLINYHFVRVANGAYCSSSAKNIMDDFKSSVVSEMKAGDTLVIQLSTVILTRK